MTAPSPGNERRFKRALVAFYLACTGAGVGITIAASALIVFGSVQGSGVIAAAAIAMALVCSFLAWRALALSRGE